jgi:hypothetical protein
VHRLAGENRQDHQVERALGNIQLLHSAPLGDQDDNDDADDGTAHLGCQDEAAGDLGDEAGVCLGPYQVTGALGAGGMGVS